MRRLRGLGRLSVVVENDSQHQHWSVVTHESGGGWGHTFLMKWFARAMPARKAFASPSVKIGRLYASIKSSLLARETSSDTVEGTDRLV